MADKRLNYFDGQFLQDQDFKDEQAYHLDRERRPLKCLTIAGVSEGLTVTAGSEEPTLTVAPGMAIDALGRQMVLETQEVVDLSEFVPSAGQTQEVNLYITYEEVLSDRAEEGSEGNRRWHEKPKIRPLDISDERPENAVLLAKATVEAEGNVTLHDSVCEYSGLQLPNGNGDGATLRYQSDGTGSRPTLTGNLAMSGELKVNASHDNDTADIAAFLSKNGSEGIGIGKNRIQAIGSTANQDITLQPKGTGEVMVKGDLVLTEEYMLKLSGKLRQMLVVDRLPYGIGVQASTIYFRSENNFAWYLKGDHSDDELDAGGGTVQMVILKDGNVGIGRKDPEKKLHVEGTVKATKFVGHGAVVYGMILMWSGEVEDIPAGWALCNGQNGTPDLRDRFIIGAKGGKNPGDTGGRTEVGLNVENMPSHKHTVTLEEAGEHSHYIEHMDYKDERGEGEVNLRNTNNASNAYKRKPELISQDPKEYIRNLKTLSQPKHNHQVQESSVGGGQPFDITPKFYALCLIMKL